MSTGSTMTKTIPIVAIITLLILCVLGLSMCSKESPKAPPISEAQRSSAQAGGDPQNANTRAEGDTPAEVLKNLSNRMSSFETALKDQRVLNQTLGAPGANAGAKGSPDSSASQPPPAPRGLPSTEVIQGKDLEIAELKRMVDQLRTGNGSTPATTYPLGTAPPATGGSSSTAPSTSSVTSAADPGGYVLDNMPAGIGFDSKADLPVPAKLGSLIRQASGNLPALTTSTQGLPGTGYVVVKPLNAREGSRPAGASVDAAARRIVNTAAAVSPTTARSVGTLSGSKGVPRTPVYTIPANATLLGSVSMTAMIGRVPNNGNVQDPYPFKIVTGADNLATNGIHIPGLQGMVWQGTAVGDWGLSCVRGTLDQVTYTFADGTIRTQDLQSAQQDGSSQGRQSRSASSMGRALAWISDSRGTCIPGERISNAAPVLTARVATSAFETAAKAYAQSQTTTLLNGVTGGGTQLLTGDALKYGGYNGLAGGAADIRRWLDERLGQTFDAVYAPPGGEVVIHINTEIPIDYAPSGRKVDHHALAASRTALD